MIDPNAANSVNAIKNIKTKSELIERIEETYRGLPGYTQSDIMQCRAALKDRAKVMACIDEVEALCDIYEKKYGNEDPMKRVLQCVQLDYRGKLCNVTDNYYQILSHDPYFSHIRFNEMSKLPVVLNEDGTMTSWTESHDAGCRSYIEKVYGIHSLQKSNDAMEIFLHSRRFNPVKDAIAQIQWDGVRRIPHVLCRWMGVEDTPYTREVSRLIFAGGIHRLYKPGCKFEDMPVLIGGQGAGKSSFVRFLAIEDHFFTELSTIEGREGSEIIEGSWIVEVSELLALTRTKEQEAVKAYLSKQTDKFRPAYGRRVEERPRTCIFVGTSNRDEFITDKTGGRRFYPVYCTNTGYSLFDHEQECRDYIKQCWAEALANIDTPYMAPFADRSIKADIELQQQNATEDDFRIGKIEDFLRKTRYDKVCMEMLWCEALGNEKYQPTRADQTQVGLIMKNMNGWKRSENKATFEKYGRQRYWKRDLNPLELVGFTESNEDVPF